MDTNIAHKIARAFVHGLAFAKGMTTLAQDAKSDMEKGDRWITVGAEAGDDGKKHGGRHVLISGTGEVKKGLSKSAQGKPLGEAIKELKDKAESKKSETKTKTKKSETPRAGLLTEQGSSLAQLAEREYDKVITAIKDDVSSIESDPTFPPEVKKYETVPIKSNLRNIKTKLSDVNKDLSTVKDEVSKAVKDGNFNRQGVESVWRAMKQLKDRAAYVVSHTNSETAWLGRNNTRGMTETAETLNRLSNEASGIRQDANRLKEEVRGSIAQFEQENANTPETHTYSAREAGLRMQRAGKEAGERASAKRAKAEKARRDATSRAKEFRQETKQIVVNDLDPSVAKLKKALDVRPLPASVHDDLVDMHRLADQIGVMANKLCSLNSRWAENSKDPSAFVVSSHGQNAKGTAERVAKLSRQSAAIAHDFGKPNNERSYTGLYAHDKIRDNLSELRGLHQDLLDHIRRIQEPEKPSSSESDRVDAMYAQKGSKPKNRIIN